MKTADLNRRRFLQQAGVYLTATGAFCLGCNAAHAEQIITGNACSYYGERLPYSVNTFVSHGEAEHVIQEILNVTGLHRSNFRVERSDDIQNAAAVIVNGERLLLYNLGFMRAVQQHTGNQWAGYSIMAHEVGHHLESHTLSSGGSRPDSELEADSYSGFIVAKLGGSLEDAQIAMRAIGSDRGSHTHPAKHRRLAAIRAGWERGHQY